MRFKLIIYIYLSFGITCWGQQILSHFTTDEGISAMQCFDVFQNSEGYIWIGTKAGVNKYDGKDIVKFDRSTGLLSDHVYSFHEDSKHRIWINNLNGEPLFIQNDEVHNRFTDNYLQGLQGDSYLNGWCEDKFNRIWFGYKEGGLKILDNDSTFSINIIRNVDGINYQLYGLFANNDEILIVSSVGIESIDIRTFETKWMHPFKGVQHFYRRLFYKDKIYLFNSINSLVFDVKKKQIKKLKRMDGNPSIYDCRVLNDSLFLSTSNGVSIVNDSLIEKYKIHASVDNIAVSAIQNDTYGNLWIATLENGLFSFRQSDIGSSNFSNYQNIVFIHRVSEDSLFLVQDDWSLKLIVNDELNSTYYLNKINESRINSIFYKDDKLWVADKNQLHIDIEGAYNTFSHYSRGVHYSNEENKFYWIGNNEVCILNNIDLLTKYPTLKSLINAHPNNYTSYSIYQPYTFELDGNKNLWIGGEEGLFCIRNDRKKKLNKPEIKGSITHLKLKGHHLIGINYGNGIFDYNLLSGEIINLTSEDGLPTNYITFLDINGSDMWVSHAMGVSLFKIDNNELKFIKNYGREHGIPKGAITLLQVVDGICHFVVNGRAYVINPIPTVNDTLHIQMDTSALSYYTDESRVIHFDCINFIFAEKMKYLYRIMPLDSDWKETNKEFVELSHIKAGEYQFEIKAQHPLNLVSPIKRRHIYINERWYNEQYFQIIVLLFFSMLIYILVKINAISFNPANIKAGIGELLRGYFMKKQNQSFRLKDVNGIVHLLNINEIQFIKSSGNYIEIYTRKRKLVSRMTMSNAVEKLKLWTEIQRVHRSYMVNFKMIEAVDHRFLKIGKIDIPFTDRYRAVIERKLQL